MPRREFMLNVHQSQSIESFQSIIQHSANNNCFPSPSSVISGGLAQDLNLKTKEWQNSVDLSDGLSTLAAAGSGLPHLVTLPRGSSSSALPQLPLPQCQTPNMASAASSSRFAHLWSPDNDNEEIASASPLTPNTKAAMAAPETRPWPIASLAGTELTSDGGPIWTNASTSPPSFYSSDSFSRSEFFRNESSLDSSSLSNSSIWSPVPPQHPQDNIGYITPTQAVQFLQVIQDIQDWTNYNNTSWDVGQRAQTNTIANLLQKHLLGVLLSPTPSPTVTSTTPIPTTHNETNSLERAARFHREVAGMCHATFTWSGQLPPRNHRNPIYSCKVFLGGVPWDITESGLVQAFKTFGNVKIEFPGKEGSPNQPKGCAYVVFENEKQVKALLQNCTHDYSKGGNWYYKISSKKMRAKDVQVIPWALCDSNFVRCQATELDPQKTIFVGALHGLLSAEGLATIIQDLFSGVVYAGIDTDRHKYPTGSGRITFNNFKSYMKAVSAAFVEIRTSKFTKKVQVDPYLEDATCSKCRLQQGPYFCRDLSCFRYFCRTCFHYCHSGDGFRSHRPLMRNSNKPQATPNATMTSPIPGNGFGSLSAGRGRRLSNLTNLTPSSLMEIVHRLGSLVNYFQF